ncbi:MAG: ABC transporter permease [Myxococcaceae bacterium]|nr:ABC transporter permease [Myxococcaceae bacterium]
MRRIVFKELREHGWVFAVLFVLFGLGLAVSLSRGDEEGGRFAALKAFVLTYGLVAALVAGNRLVVREYTGKTQLFLETLPISRLRVVVTKWLVGWAWVTFSVTSAWAATWWWQAKTTPVPPLDALYALVPAVLWMTCFWAVCFVAGLLGRYRLLFWVVSGLFVYGLDTVGQLVVMQTPPFRLASESLAVANAWPEAIDVVVGSLVIGVGLLVGLVLPVVGEGSIATTLSGRMTSRERIFSASTLLVGFMLFSVLTRDRDRPAFALESVIPKDSPVGPIGVLPGEGVSDAQAQALVEAIAIDVVTFVQAMEYPKLAGVYVVSQRGLDPDIVLRVPLGEKDGHVFRANVADPRFDPLMLRYRILHSIVGDHTDHRALEEDRHWLLDGFASYWNTRGDAEARALLRRRAAASPVSLSPQAIARWDETFERAGDCFGMGISFTLVDALVDELGEGAVIELARRTFVKPHESFRDVLFEEKLPALLTEKKVDFARLIERAEAARRNAGGPLGYQGAYELVPRGGGQTQVRFRLSRHGQPVTRWRGLTASTAPWQAGISDTEPTRVDARAGDALAPATFTSGERLFVAIEVDDDELKCSARVLQAWEVLP